LEENPMISNAGSRRRMTLALGLVLALGLGAAIAWQPALAGVNEADASLSLPGSAGLIPQAQVNDEGLQPRSNEDAPIIFVDKNKNKHNNKNWNKNYSNKNIYVTKKKVYVQPWKRKPYYGNFFGGVVLGSILTATAVGIAPPPPRPDLCWYWSDPYMYRGYWDYCY
jgi:hypothetical protein